MPTLAERRRQQASVGGAGASGEFIKFKTEGETRILRFLFTDASTIESHRKYWNEETKQWEIDGDKGAYRIVFNCVEYEKGGANPRKVRWEISEYLYNEYLAPYVEKDTPASKNVWEIKVRRPGTMDVSYVAFKVDGATDITYPVLADEAEAAPAPAPTPAAPVAPAPAEPVAPAPAPTPAPTPAPVAEAAPAEPVAPTKKSKYF